METRNRRNPKKTDDQTSQSTTTDGTQLPRVTALSTTLYVLLSCTYWINPHWRTKISPILLLSAISNRVETLFAGLVMSAAGDVLLELEKGDKNLFIGGIACFLMAHLCYARAFTSNTTPALMHPSTRNVALPVCIAIYVILLYVLLPGIATNKKDLVAPVVVYGFVILSMVIAAHNRHAHQDNAASLLGLAGAAVFFCSDVLIAVDKFRSPLPHAKTCVMITYYIGQGLIAASLSGESRGFKETVESNEDASQASSRRKSAAAKGVNARLHLSVITTVCALSLCPGSALALSPPPRVLAKAAFLQSIAQQEPVRATDLALERLIAAGALPNAPSPAPIEQSAQSEALPLGTWQIVFAPHIRILSLLLQTRFDVYYLFQPGNKMLSNVKYSSRLFGTGHLSTFGSYSLETQAGTQPVTKITWDRIWWDVLDEAPSLEEEVDKHVLPGVIQAVGKAAFVEGVSVFPVQFLDDDLCVFLFQLLGTRICAKRIA